MNHIWLLILLVGLLLMVVAAAGWALMSLVELFGYSIGRGIAAGRAKAGPGKE